MFPFLRMAAFPWRQDDINLTTRKRKNNDGCKHNYREDTTPTATEQLQSRAREIWKVPVRVDLRHSRPD